MSSSSPGGHGDCRNDGLAPGQPPNSTVDAAAPAGLHQLRTARPPERPSGIFKAPQEGTTRLKHQQHLQATDSSRWDMEQRDRPCRIGGLGAVATPVSAKDFPKHVQTVNLRAVAAVGHTSELDRRQDAIPKPMCAAAAGSPTGQSTPSMSRGPYHTFFATEPSKPAKHFFAGHPRGLAGHSNVHSESLNHKTGQSGIEKGIEVPSPSPCEGPGAGATAASHVSSDFKNNRGHKGQRRLLKSSLDTNRRVRSWWPRDSKVAPEDGRNSQCLNAAAGLATASLCHSSSNTGKAQAQHSGCLTLPDTARGGPVGGCSKRGTRGPVDRGSCKVSFAPAAAKTTVQARRACSTCIKAIQGCSAAAASPVVGETTAGGSTCTGGEDDEGAQDRLHSRGSEVTPTVLYSTGALDGPEASLPAAHSQPAGKAAVPLLSREGSRADAGQPRNAMDERGPMPRAAKNVSAAATRAAAVAKAAAAVAAAAQAEVVAAATVAAWGESRSCVPTCTSLSSEQRREQLALILRLLLLLPPELQHDIQARLFMLKQQQQRHRWSSAASHRWPKRAATTASLPMTAAASGILGGSWWSHQHQQPHFAASTSTPSFTVPLPFDVRDKRSRSSSRSSSSTPSGVVLKLQQQCMQQQQQQGDRQPPPQQQQQLLRNSPGESTVNGLFMSATLQASAVLQLTPGRHAGESLAAAADPAGAAATTRGGSAAQVSSSAKLSSCRCHKGTARGPYNRPPSSFLVHGRNSLQQQHQQNSQNVTEGGAAGCSNFVGSVHSSCCRLRCSPSNQAGEALLAAALPQRSVGPSCSGCRRCEGATAAANVSSSTTCCIGTSSCCSRSQGQALNSAQQQQSVAVRGSRSHRGTASLLCYYSASGQLSTSTTAIPQPSSQCCHTGRESFHIKKPSLASQQQQQQQQELTAEDDTTDTSVAAAAVAAVPPSSRHRGLVDGGVEGCMRSGRGTCPPGSHQQQPGRCGGQQQKSCNAAATQPHVIGLHMAPSRGGCRSAGSCSSSYSGSCGWIDQGLLQVQMSSVPSFLRSGAVLRPSNNAADLATLRSSWARLLLAARGGKDTPRTLALSPQTDSSVLGSISSNSSSRNTASSNTVTSNSLSDTSREASQDTRLFQTGGERLCAEAETYSTETDVADEEQQQQQGAAAAVEAATVGVSPLSQTCVQNREVLRSGGPLLVFQSGALAGVPSSPESGTGGSPGSLLSAGLTVACLSPRQDRRPSGDAAVAVENLDACVRLSPAPWAAEEGLEFFSTETLPAPLLPTLPVLPGSSSSNSGKSPLSPTSLLFSSSDPRRYIGPLVKSAVISIESLPASMVLPALSKSSSGLDVEFPLGITQQHKAAALLQLHLLPVGMRNMASDSSLKLRQQQSRQPMSCPELQVVQTASSAKKLLSGIVSRTSWRTKETVSLLTQRKRSGALYALCRCQPPSRPCSRSSLTHGLSKQGAPLFTEEPLQCAAPPVEGCNSQQATPVVGQCRQNMHTLTEKHGSIAACAIGTEQEGCVGPGLRKLRQEVPLGSCLPETVLDIRRLLRSSFQEPTMLVASAPMGGAAEMQKYGNAHIRERLGRYWGLAESLVGFNSPGLDWRTRNVYGTAECLVSQPLKLRVERGISGTGENLCELLPPLATSQMDLPFGSLFRVAGSPLRPAEEGGNDLTDTEQPSVNAFAFVEIDPGDSLDVLRSHAEAQESLAAQRQLNLADVIAASAILSGSGVAASGLQVYAKSTKRACSSTMQRALKSTREMAALQATDEGIVLLRRFQEELTRLSTELESAKLPPEQCSRPTSSRSSSPSELSMRLVAKIEKLLAVSRSPLPVVHSNTNIILRSVPELLLLSNSSCTSWYGTSLRCMAGTIRGARRLTARKISGCISAPFGGESCVSLNVGRCCAMAARFERTQNALKEIARNLQLVAIKGAFKMFTQNTGDGAEVSSLKLLQDQHAAATAGGAQVPLDKLKLEQKEALKHLPLEMAPAEQVRVMLQPVAKQFAACLPAIKSSLQAAKAKIISECSSNAQFQLPIPPSLTLVFSHYNYWQYADTDVDWPHTAMQRSALTK